MRRVVASCMIGNAFEWYDFAIYGHLAVTLSRLFFPHDEGVIGLVKTFAVFAVGFLTRPLGAVLFGWLGDYLGRRQSLVLSVGLMAVSTVAIGLLPTYAQVGVLAPILMTLLKALQGLSVGGEFSGSVIYVVEHAPNRRRGLAGGTAMMSTGIGFLMGAGVAAGLTHVLTPEQFESWGWRLPFLIGFVPGVIGFYLRHHCDESPHYEEAKSSGNISKQPVREVLKQHMPALIKGFFSYLTVTIPFFSLSIYLISFMQKNLGVSTNLALLINACAMLMLVAVMPLGAWASDKFGRKPVLIAAAGLLCVAIIPCFQLMLTANTTLMLVAQLIFAAILGLYLAPMPAFLVELFPTRVRFTGMSLSYNTCAVLGGLVPAMSTFIIERTGNQLSLAFIIAACCVISVVALLWSREGYKQAL